MWHRHCTCLAYMPLNSMRLFWCHHPSVHVLGVHVIRRSTACDTHSLCFLPCICLAYAPSQAKRHAVQEMHVLFSWCTRGFYRAAQKQNVLATCACRCSSRLFSSTGRLPYFFFFFRWYCTSRVVWFTVFHYFRRTRVHSRMSIKLHNHGVMLRYMGGAPIFSRYRHTRKLQSPTKNRLTFEKIVAHPANTR